MFCSYCGTNNTEDSVFCKSCGARMLVAPQTVAQNNLPLNTYSNNYYTPPQQNQSQATNIYSSSVATPTYSRMSAKAKNFYITTLIIHIITVVLFFVPTLFSRASTTSGELVREETASMFDLFYNMSIGFGFIVTIIILGSAIITALPLFNIEGKKPPTLLFPKIINILLMLWTIFYSLIMLLFAIDQAEKQSNYYGIKIEATAGLNIWGVAYLASILVLIIMLFVTTSKDKRKKII